MDLRNIILAAPDVIIERVSIPEWNTDVFVRAITGCERDKFEQDCVKTVKRLRKNKLVSESKISMENARARLAILAMCKSETDPSPIFTDADLPALSKKLATAMNRIYEVAARLAGINETDLEELSGN